MNVVYDISVLSSVYNNNGHRTGIVRAITNIALELSMRKDIKLYFSATRNIEYMRNCFDFVKSTKAFNAVDLFIPRKVKICFSISRKLSMLQKSMGLLGRSIFVNKVFLFIKHRILLFCEKIILNDQKYYNQSINNINIYQSSFDSLSQDKLMPGSKNKFVIIYDLSPVLFPQFYDEHAVDGMKNIYDSIDKETWVLCISEATRKDLIAYNGSEIDPSKVCVTYLAASDFFYQSNDTLYNRSVLNKYCIPNKPYVLALSILHPRKNMLGVIEAFFELIDKKEIRDLHLVMVGPSGSDTLNIMDAISKNPLLKERVILTGFVQDHELAAIYSEAKMFVYPSFYEGFGLPVIEAMQCGVPVITSNNSSLPEVVGDAAILVDPYSNTEIADAMYQIYADEQLYVDMSIKGLAHSKKFSWERCVDDILGSYRKSMDYEN